MALTKELSSIKRFGPRYGGTVKHKLALIEREHKRLHKCPSCSKKSLKRLSAGIWQCKKCGVKIAGKAYTISKEKPPVVIAEEEAEAEETEKVKEE